MMAVDIQHNGGKYIDDVDGEDPEYQRQLMRPVEVKEDVRQMEERRRVKQVLHSSAFCEELQELVLDQLHPQLLHSRAANSSNSQLISDFIMPHARAQLMKKGVGPCIPVADVKELDVMDYDKGERQFRCRLASLYRLTDLFGWAHGIQSYITGRINQDFEHFLIAAYGMLHHEVTASSLVKVDMRGEILDPGSTTLGVNKTAFSLHSAIYAARPDIKCIVHLRNTPAMSISALKAGLLPLCPEAMMVGDVSLVEYRGGFLDLEQRDRLRRAVGPINKVFILHNFGIIVGGETIEEAFYLSRNVMAAVEHQLGVIRSGGFGRVVLPTEEERRRAVERLGGEGHLPPELLFETLMKHLDNAGYRTGYVYRDQAGDQTSGKPSGVSVSDVAIPPSTTSFNYSTEEGGRVTSPVRGRPGSSQGGRIKSQTSSSSGSRQQQQQQQGGWESSYSELDTTRASKWAPEDTSTPIKPEGGARKESRQKEQLETTLSEETYRQQQQQSVAAVPRSSSSEQQLLRDREPSQERSGTLSGRETPGSTKDKKKKKWPFGSKKKESE